ncbi:Osteoclast-stimulating factor 1, partial [Chytridiales sp. JEL 0842]
VLSKDDVNWWKCRIDDKEGLVPANYVGENTATIENPLHEAAKRGNVPFTIELLEAGVSVNGLDKAANTPLHWACRGGHLQVVQLLLAKNPAVSAQNKLGDTPLHLAAWGGNIQVVSALLEHPSIQPALKLKNKNNETPVALAKNDEVAAMLIQFEGGGGARGLGGDGEEGEESD